MSPISICNSQWPIFNLQFSSIGDSGMTSNKRPLTVRIIAPTETASWRRFLPASFASLLFHGLLFTALVLLSSSGQAEVLVESVPQETIIGTETQTYDPARDDPFLSSVSNPGSTE